MLGVEATSAYFGLGLHIPALASVTILWRGGAGGAGEADMGEVVGAGSGDGAIGHAGDVAVDGVDVVAVLEGALAAGDIAVGAMGDIAAMCSGDAALSSAGDVALVSGEDDAGLTVGAEGVGAGAGYTIIGGGIHGSSSTTGGSEA